MSLFQEASSINRSLMCLGQVIMALVDVSNGKNRHICYRDSKLTFLLRVSVSKCRVSPEWRMHFCWFDLKINCVIHIMSVYKIVLKSSVEDVVAV